MENESSENSWCDFRHDDNNDMNKILSSSEESEVAQWSSLVNDTYISNNSAVWNVNLFPCRRASVNYIVRAANN